MGANKNPDFTQMQGVEKILPRRIYLDVPARNFFRNTAVGMKYEFLGMPGCSA
jgi:hypothetical protein